MTELDKPSRPILHSVAMVGIVLHEDQVLLIQRMDNGKWENPAGVMELNESPRACVEREVLEETGVEARALHITGVYKNLAHPLRPVSIAWVCSYLSGDPNRTDESRQSRWVPVPLLPDFLRPAHLIRSTDAIEYETRGYPTVRIHDGTTVMYSDVE